MLIVEPVRALQGSEEALFQGLLSNVARKALLQSGYSSFVLSSAENIDEYVRYFSKLWQRSDNEHPPDPEEVKRQMEERESILYDVWRIALRNDFPKESMPLVAQAPITKSANPFIFWSQGLRRPLVVMSEQFWSFIAGSVFGVLHWAEGQGSHEAQGKKLVTASAKSWLANDPLIGPSGIEMAQATTVDLDISNFAVGLADAAFTWAFLHEMGHFVLGHLPSSKVMRWMSADGTATASSIAYDQNDEITADRFGLDRFLGLMPFTPQIRRSIRFGPQIDHAPVIALELMDLAYRIEGRLDLLESTSHPAPLERGRLLLEARADGFSDEGRDWYEYWHERLVAMRTELGC